MEELELKQLWRAYDIKLEKSLQLNQRIIKDMQTQRAEDNITSFRRGQIFNIVAGIVWIAFLVYLVLHGLNDIYFAVSVGLIAVFNIFAVGAYIRHLALLDRVNIADSITGAQEKLAVIQTSLNKVGRILILQTPLYCTFWYNQELVDHGGTQFWVINLVIVALFTAASVYLFNTLTYKNINRRWVKLFIGGFGGKKLIKAMEFLNEIEDYKAECD